MSRLLMHRFQGWERWDDFKPDWAVLSAPERERLCAAIEAAWAPPEPVRDLESLERAFRFQVVVGDAAGWGELPEALSHPDMSASMAAPASESLLRAWEERAGLKLPALLRAFLRRVSGGYLGQFGWIENFCAYPNPAYCGRLGGLQPLTACLEEADIACAAHASGIPIAALRSSLPLEVVWREHEETVELVGFPADVSAQWSPPGTDPPWDTVVEKRWVAARVVTLLLRGPERGTLLEIAGGRAERPAIDLLSWLIAFYYARIDAVVPER